MDFGLRKRHQEFSLPAPFLCLLDLLDVLPQFRNPHFYLLHQLGKLHMLDLVCARIFHDHVTVFRFRRKIDFDGIAYVTPVPIPAHQIGFAVFQDAVFLHLTVFEIDEASGFLFFLVLVRGNHVPVGNDNIVESADVIL